MSRLRSLGALACVAGALGALPAAAPANVQVGSSGWQWGNPLPQGNSLRAISFTGARGYAAGDFGTLLRTDDGGVGWTGLPVGTFANLQQVQAIDADSVVAGGGCVLRRSDDGGATFKRIAFLPAESFCRESLAELSFTGENNGYVVLTDGTVFLTIDGGNAFAQKSAIPGTRSPGGHGAPTALAFTSDTAGFAATSEGKLYHTTDAANSWQAVKDFDGAINSIVFSDALHGFLVGDRALFARTSDGGVTWTTKDVGAPSPYNLTSIRCATTLLCVIATQSGAVLVRTADGGDTFTFVTPSTDPVYAAAFAGVTRVAAVGSAGATVISDDAGQTFSPIGGRLTGRFSRIRAGLVPGSAFAPGADGALARTIDAGRTWSRTSVNTSQDVLDVAFPTTTEGYALDTEGGLFRTEDGGATWRILDPGTTAPAQALYAPSKTTVLLVGGRGVRRSTDGGGTFDGVTGLSRVPLGAVDRAGSAIVVWGSQDVLESADGGKSFKALRKPGPYKRIRGKLVNRRVVRFVDFADANNGYLVDGTGRLFKTRNRGRTWAELAGTATNQIGGMAFSGTKNGYLVIPGFGDAGAAGFLLRTADGGATWHPQLVVAERIAQPLGIAAPGGGTDYVLGGTSSLLFSTSGGDAGAASTLTIRTKSRKLRKKAHITVTGKLSPALGGERVTVAYRAPGTSFWRTQTVKTAATGAFTTSWNVRKGTNVFVAQWQGDFHSAGDGSPVLTVQVGKKR